MQVKLKKTVPLRASSHEAWRLLQDVTQVAECVPGAHITERLDGTHYRGEVRVKIGPAAATFQGEIEVRSLDAEKHELRLIGKGKDAKGTSTATMDLTASLRDEGAGGSELSGVSEVTVTGKVASLGGRMLNQVADRILDQFATNFSTRLSAMDMGATAENPEELHPFALFWRVFADFLRSLFRRKPGKAG